MFTRQRAITSLKYCAGASAILGVGYIQYSDNWRCRKARGCMYTRVWLTCGPTVANNIKCCLDKPIVLYVLATNTSPWDYLRGRLVSVRDFRQLFPATRCVKLLHDPPQHYDLVYDHPGTYVDPRPLYARGHCKPGGIYFMSENNLEFAHRYCFLYKNISRVKPSPTSMVYISKGGKLKTDSLIVGESLGNAREYIYGQV